MDIVVEELIIEEDRPEHIVKHGVKVSEVREIVDGRYAYYHGKRGRWILIGKTNEGRVLAVIIGPRKIEGKYGLVTARPASREERSFYKEFTFQIGGRQNGKN